MRLEAQRKFGDGGRWKICTEEQSRTEQHARTEQKKDMKKIEIRKKEKEDISVEQKKEMEKKEIKKKENEDMRVEPKKDRKKKEIKKKENEERRQTERGVRMDKDGKRKGGQASRAGSSKQAAVATAAAANNAEKSGQLKSVIVDKDGKAHTASESLFDMDKVLDIFNDSDQIMLSPLRELEDELLKE